MAEGAECEVSYETCENGAGRVGKRPWSRRRAAACATPAATMPWRTRVRRTGPTAGAATSTRRRDGLVRVARDGSGVPGRRRRGGLVGGLRHFAFAGAYGSAAAAAYARRDVASCGFWSSSGNPTGEPGGARAGVRGAAASRHPPPRRRHACRPRQEAECRAAVVAEGLSGGLRQLRLRRRLRLGPRLLHVCERDVRELRLLVEFGQPDRRARREPRAGVRGGRPGATADATTGATADATTGATADATTGATADATTVATAAPRPVPQPTPMPICSPTSA